MGGGLMQLVAYGAQDLYLTGNPQITFFKVVYRRHTNFSIESIEQVFSGTADFKGDRFTQPSQPESKNNLPELCRIYSGINSWSFLPLVLAQC